MDASSAIFGAIFGGGSGSGGGSTTNYNSLNNHPKINNNELIGNKTAAALGLQDKLTFDEVPTANSNNSLTSGAVADALDSKVTVQQGKGLSTNDYSDAEKLKLAGVAAGAEANVIIAIKVNGTTVVPVNREIALNILTETVNNLTNYYTKSQTYTQAEVNALIGNLTSLNMQIVAELPTTDISTTTIYLVQVGSSSTYSQYIYTNNDWALLGSTTVDLNNYYTKSQVDALLAEKQDELTFDTEPTEGSNNPITSGGVAAALADITPEIATLQDPGTVKPDGTTITLDIDGTIHSVSADKIYKGTKAAFQQLAPEVQNSYTIRMFTDDDIEIKIATVQNVGVVKPDGTSITIDQDGTIHSTSAPSFDQEDFVVNNGLVSLASASNVPLTNLTTGKSIYIDTSLSGNPSGITCKKTGKIVELSIDQIVFTDGSSTELKTLDIDTSPANPYYICDGLPAPATGQVWIFVSSFYRNFEPLMFEIKSNGKLELLTDNKLTTTSVTNKATVKQFVPYSGHCVYIAAD